MRKLCFLLLMLSFLTAYGRCVADQLGMLHTSDASCCVAVCDNVVKSCVQCPEETSSDTTQPPPEQTPEPSPCQLCIIIDAEGAVAGKEIRLTTLNTHEHSGHSGHCLLSGSFIAVRPVVGELHQVRKRAHADHSGELRARLLRLTCKALPIRGPSTT